MTAFVPPSNADLRFDAAREGDTAALTSLLEEAGPQVRSTLELGAKWQSALDLDDVMQVTYLEVCLRIEQFAGDSMPTFRAWMRRIAQNNLTAAIRGLSRDKRPQPQQRVQPQVRTDSYEALCELIGVGSSSPSGRASKREAKELVEQALAELPPDYSAAIRAFDLDGCTGPQAAERLGRSRGAAFMLLARARDRLRDHLGSGSKFFPD